MPRNQVDLYWLPLGAGDALPIVRWNGRVYEAITARREGRAAGDLYHAALEVRADAVRYVIEVAPAWSGRGVDHGAVRQGPVGFTWLGRSRLFRYEVRCWRNGVIPDLRHAVGGARRLSDDEHASRRLLRLVGEVPTATWGRDEQRVGDMWNSNAVVAWLVVRAGLDAGLAALPRNGRAPGWQAGVLAATRRPLA